MEDLHSTIDLGKVAIGYHLGWLVANTDLEASWAPVDKRDGALGLEGSDGGVNVLGDHITTVEQASGHILAVSRVALHHLVIRLETRHRDLLDRICFMGSLNGRDNRRVCNEREMDAWVWYQIGLELVQVNVQRAVKTQGCCDGRDD